jgi:hypothetical protein
LRPGEAAERLHEIGLGTHVEPKQVAVWLKDVTILNRAKGRPPNKDKTTETTTWQKREFLQSIFLSQQPQKCLLTDY